MPRATQPQVPPGRVRRQTLRNKHEKHGEHKCDGDLRSRVGVDKNDPASEQNSSTALDHFVVVSLRLVRLRQVGGQPYTQVSFPPNSLLQHAVVREEEVGVENGYPYRVKHNRKARVDLESLVPGSAADDTVIGTEVVLAVVERFASEHLEHGRTDARVDQEGQQEDHGHVLVQGVVETAF